VNSHLFKPAFFVLLIIFAAREYGRYTYNATVKEKAVNLSVEVSRFNSENWKNVVPVVKEATTDLRVLLGIENLSDEIEKRRAEAEKEKQEQAEIALLEENQKRRTTSQMHADVIGAIQMATAPLPKEFEFKKADPLSIDAEHARLLEEKIRQAYPSCTNAQCSAISIAARAYLSARGKGLADDVVRDIRDDCHTPDMCNDYHDSNEEAPSDDRPDPP
jgi:hypothetical protein